jgi:hypothetical protein
MSSALCRLSKFGVAFLVRLITGKSQRHNRVLLITAELAYLFAVTETKGWAMRSLIPACIVVVGSILQSHHANAMTTAELVDSCKAVDQTAQSASGDNLDISPEGLPCWYYMSAVQNMSALVDSGNEHCSEFALLSKAPLWTSSASWCAPTDSLSALWHGQAIDARFRRGAHPIPTSPSPDAG